MRDDPTPDLDAPDAAPPSGPAAWFDPAKRLPRRGQLVWVRTPSGVDHRATFEVAYTEDWPAGASWMLPTGKSYPFAEIARWSPDVDAEPTAPVASAARPEPTAPTAGPPPLAVEIDAEIKRTKRVLQLLPPNLMDWSPHPAIPTLETLALRTVRIAARIGWILDLDELERSFEPDLPPFETVDQIVLSFGAAGDEVAGLLRALTEERLAEPWRLVRNADLVAQMPRGHALRWYGLTPLIHHRAEISLMLRALGLDPPHLYPEWSFDDSVSGTEWEVPAEDGPAPAPGPDPELDTEAEPDAPVDADARPEPDDEVASDDAAVTDPAGDAVAEPNPDGPPDSETEAEATDEAAGVGGGRRTRPDGGGRPRRGPDPYQKEAEVEAGQGEPPVTG